MARFTAIPAVPQGGITDWQSVLISSVKENVELLTGLRGETDLASKAVTRGQITLLEQPDQNMKQISAKGSGFTISGQEVAGLDDYGLNQRHGVVAPRAAWRAGGRGWWEAGAEAEAGAAAWVWVRGRG